MLTGHHRITVLDQDGVGRFVLFGDDLGNSEGFELRNPSGPVVNEEYPLLGPIGMRDRSLGKDGQGVLYPVDNYYVVGGFLLGLVGHREQRALLIQNTPPQVVWIFRLHCSRGHFGPFCSG